jgi:hypothetical protein
MSDAMEIQKAIHEFAQFVNFLSAMKARHVAFGERDAEAKPFTVEVPRDEALNCFLKTRQHYNRFRNQLSESRGEQEVFFFDPDLWKEAQGR